MTQMPYDLTSPESILDYARGLSGKTLAEVVDLDGMLENIKNKGDLGNMVERYYFRHIPPNNHEPDFAEAKVELKTTGVKKNKNGDFQAKERLVLTMMNYMTLVDENWSKSSLMYKCRLMLLMFYFYQKDIPVYDRRFVYEPLLWTFPKTDLSVIESDWKIIQQKIMNGKAHELSEGDTFYLGACRKGSGGIKEALRKQPFSPIGAKARAFSLKPSYINTILNSHATESEILNDEKAIHEGLEYATYKKFDSYLGMSEQQLSTHFNMFKKGKNDKGFYRNLTMRILGEEKRTIPEFEKAGIELKTIRLKQNGIPKEDMSFPIFRYLEIVKEEWEESGFFNKIEQRFFFVVFKYDEKDVLRLYKVMYWNMPYEDREEARKVWEKTKSQIATGMAEFLPKMSESRVAHVRPHGKNKADTIPTPHGKMLVKKCFWLNRKYIAEQIK